MKLIYIFNTAPLHIAVQKENPEIVKLLLGNNELNINILYVFDKYLIEYEFNNCIQF